MTEFIANIIEIVSDMLREIADPNLKSRYSIFYKNPESFIQAVDSGDLKRVYNQGEREYVIALRICYFLAYRFNEISSTLLEIWSEKNNITDFYIDESILNTAIDIRQSGLIADICKAPLIVDTQILAGQKRK